MQNSDKYENFHEIGFLRRKVRECSTKVSLGEAMTTKTFLKYSVLIIIFSLDRFCNHGRRTTHQLQQAALWTRPSGLEAWFGYLRILPANVSPQGIFHVCGARNCHGICRCHLFQAELHGSWYPCHWGLLQGESSALSGGMRLDWTRYVCSGLYWGNALGIFSEYLFLAAPRNSCLLLMIPRKMLNKPHHPVYWFSEFKFWKFDCFHDEKWMRKVDGMGELIDIVRGMTGRSKLIQYNLNTKISLQRDLCRIVSVCVVNWVCS